MLVLARVGGVLTPARVYCAPARVYCTLTRVYCALTPARVYCALTPARVLPCTHKGVTVHSKSVAILVIRGLDLVCCTLLYVYAVLTFSLFDLGDDIIPDACGQSTIMNENPAFASADGSWEVLAVDNE